MSRAGLGGISHKICEDYFKNKINLTAIYYIMLVISYLGIKKLFDVPWLK